MAERRRQCCPSRALWVTAVVSLNACATTAGPLALGSLAAHIEAPEARVLWVGAHPDDESLAGPILARTCKTLRRPCLLFVLTHGEGGACRRWPSCHPNLGAVRRLEMREVARRYRARLLHLGLPNAPLPWESFPERSAIAASWRARMDVGRAVADAIRRFRPTVILTFDPNGGVTRHPEHQLAARFALEGAVRAGREDAAGGAARPWRVPAFYYLLSSSWLARLAGRADPATPTDELGAHLPCGAPGRSCLDLSLAVEGAHETQAQDVRMIRALRPLMGTIFARRVEPEVEAEVDPPFEPAR